MRQALIKTLVAIFGVIFCLYLLLPPPKTPSQMPGSFKSIEPADNEDPLRVGFYTDWDRPQVIAFFKKESSTSSFMGIPLPTLELNYPPEEAPAIIRDQTQSRYLEEFAHPLRESLFVNGFFAQKDSERMFANGREYKTKVIIRSVPSNNLIRLGITTLAVALLYKTLTDLSLGLKKLLHD